MKRTIEMTQAEYFKVMEQFGRLSRHSLDGYNFSQFDAWFTKEYDCVPWEQVEIRVFR